ncbi:MAG: fibronectin type III domain-containing protein [Acidimicrobiia bacterium]|nr:fibronectin type III domain-containing protein [Acidimicrobiia bacterium]
MATPVDEDDDETEGSTEEPPPLADPTKCTDTRATFDTGTAPQNLEVSGRDGGSLPAVNGKLTVEWDPVPGSACYDIWWGAELRDSSKMLKGRKYWKLGAHVYVQTVYYPPADHPSGQKLSINLTQVVANTKYDVKVRAANATTASPWTEIEVGQTGNAIGKPEITFMRIESSSSIYVDWTYASGAHAFELQYRKKDTNSWSSRLSCPTQEDYAAFFFENVWDEATDDEKDQLRTTYQSIFGTNFDGPVAFEAVRDSRTVTGLDANSIYEFQVRGVADNDTCSDTSDNTYGAWSDIAEAVTIPASWITAVTASLDANDAPQLTVTWPAVTDADSYKVEYQDLFFRDTGSWFTHPGTATTNSVTIDDVECGLQYWVRVRAEFGDLHTPWSDAGDATTETETNGCDDS